MAQDDGIGIGDDELAALYAEYQPRIRQFFRTKGFDDAASADLTQETFCQAVRGRARFERRAALVTWLVAIANNLWKRRVRDQNRAKRTGHEEPLDALEDQRRDRLLAEVADAGVGADDPVARLIDAERRQNLQTAFAALSPRQVECVRLRYEEGLKSREIAAVLRLRAGTVKGYLAEAKARLQAVLEPDRVDRPAG